MQSPVSASGIAPRGMGGERWIWNGGVMVRDFSGAVTRQRLHLPSPRGEPLAKVDVDGAARVDPEGPLLNDGAVRLQAQLVGRIEDARARLDFCETLPDAVENGAPDDSPDGVKGPAHDCAEGLAVDLLARGPPDLRILDGVKGRQRAGFRILSRRNNAQDGKAVARAGLRHRTGVLESVEKAQSRLAQWVIRIGGLDQCGGVPDPGRMRKPGASSVDADRPAGVFRRHWDEFIRLPDERALRKMPGPFGLRPDILRRDGKAAAGEVGHGHVGIEIGRA